MKKEFNLYTNEPGFTDKQIIEFAENHVRSWEGQTLYEFEEDNDEPLWNCHVIKSEVLSSKISDRHDDTGCWTVDVETNYAATQWQWEPDPEDIEEPTTEHLIFEIVVGWEQYYYETEPHLEFIESNHRKVKKD